MIEIVDGGTNVARQEIHGFADLRWCGSFLHNQRQMFFAGRARCEFGMANYKTSWNTGVGRDSFVASIAGDNASARLADDASQDQYGRPIAAQVGKLGEAGGITIDNRAGGNAVDELRVAKTCKGKRAWEGGRSGGDDFGDMRSAWLYFVHNIQ